MAQRLSESDYAASHIASGQLLVLKGLKASGKASGQACRPSRVMKGSIEAAHCIIPSAWHHPLPLL